MSGSQRNEYLTPSKRKWDELSSIIQRPFKSYERPHQTPQQFAQRRIQVLRKHIKPSTAFYSVPKQSRLLQLIDAPLSQKQPRQLAPQQLKQTLEPHKPNHTKFEKNETINQIDKLINKSNKLIGSIDEQKRQVEKESVPAAQKMKIFANSASPIVIPEQSFNKNYNQVLATPIRDNSLMSNKFPMNFSSPSSSEKAGQTFNQHNSLFGNVGKETPLFTQEELQQFQESNRISGQPPRSLFVNPVKVNFGSKNQVKIKEPLIGNPIKQSQNNFPNLFGGSLFNKANEMKHAPTIQVSKAPKLFLTENLPTLEVNQTKQDLTKLNFLPFVPPISPVPANKANQTFNQANIFSSPLFSGDTLPNKANQTNPFKDNPIQKSQTTTGPLFASAGPLFGPKTQQNKLPNPNAPATDIKYIEETLKNPIDILRLQAPSKINNQKQTQINIINLHPKTDTTSIINTGVVKKQAPKTPPAPAPSIISPAPEPPLMPLFTPTSNTTQVNPFKLAMNNPQIIQKPNPFFSSLSNPLPKQTPAGDSLITTQTNPFINTKPIDKTQIQKKQTKPTPSIFSTPAFLSNTSSTNIFSQNAPSIFFPAQTSSSPFADNKPTPPLQTVADQKEDEGDADELYQQEEEVAEGEMLYEYKSQLQVIVKFECELFIKNQDESIRDVIVSLEKSATSDKQLLFVKQKKTKNIIYRGVIISSTEAVLMKSNRTNLRLTPVMKVSNNPADKPVFDVIRIKFKQVAEAEKFESTVNKKKQ